MAQWKKLPTGGKGRPPTERPISKAGSPLTPSKGTPVAPPTPQKATISPGPKLQTPKVGNTYARGPKANAGAAMPRPVRRRKQKGI